MIFHMTFNIVIMSILGLGPLNLLVLLVDTMDSLGYFEICLSIICCAKLGFF